MFAHPHFETVFNTFNKHVEFSLEDWQVFEPCLKVVEIGRKQRIQEVGEPIKAHHFIISGLVRWFYITPQGKELNKGFYDEHYIVGNLSAMILNEPSRFAIETLEPCIMVSMNAVQIERLQGKCESWQRLFDHCCKLQLIRNERREAELLTLSASERYSQFVKNFAHCLDRIPQYHVASYLGINPVSLSKFKQQWLQKTA